MTGCTAWPMRTMPEASVLLAMSPPKRRSNTAAELVLAGDDPCPCLLGEQPAHLLGDDVHLLADLGADLHQRMPVMGAHTLGRGQFVAHDLARQCRVQWLASMLLR